MINFTAIDRKGTNCSKWDGLKNKFGKEDLLALWVADMDLAVPKRVRDTLQERLKHPVYAYTLNSDSFYQSIIDWYNTEFDWQIEKEWILPEHGVVVSINAAIEAFTQKGDGVLVQTPVYPPFTTSIKRHERKIVESCLSFNDGITTIDFNDFEKKAKDAKLFLLCSPHNPSTRAWTKNELEQMVDICYRNDVVIVSDEIHSDLVFNSIHLPVATMKYAKDITLTLHAPSKTFNIAGLNTSYLIVPNLELRRKYKSAHDKFGLSSGNVFGLTALEAAYTEGKEWLEALREQLVVNSQYIKEYISSNIPEITVYRHDATFLMWLDCSALGLDDKQLSEFFINEAELGLNSGISFGEAGSGFMRLNIGTDLNTLKEAMRRLYSAIEGRQ